MDLAYTLMYVDDVEATMKFYSKAFGLESGFLAEGAQPVSKPKTKPWGQVVSYVRDCNGFLVEICSPIG